MNGPTVWRISRMSSESAIGWIGGGARMIRRGDTAVVERNRTWSGAYATEPYGAGWAGHAIFFVRALQVVGTPGAASARVQVTPDSIRWCDEGTTVPLPSRDEGVTFTRVRCGSTGALHGPRRACSGTARVAQTFNG